MKKKCWTDMAPFDGLQNDARLGLWLQKDGKRAKSAKVVAAVAVLYLVAQFFFVAPYDRLWQAIYNNIGIPDGYSIRGVDVSHHQGAINWEKLSRAIIKDEPVSFVFIKATEGVSVSDDDFKHNFEQAKKYGILRGAYHFFSPTVPAAKQADHFIKTAQLQPGDLAPVLDIEEVGNLSDEAVRTEALIWLKAVEKKYGVKPILYTYLKMKEEYFSTPEFDDYHFWLAHYYLPEIRYKGKWKFWQHTDRGRLPGIKGSVDLNVYNGSMYNLREHTIQHVN